uniref:histidine kinase n=1 Tax=Chromera velia CCMP2878 TaxID=1169474 RepID=A0A0G4I5D9_9ALVE|eukprot:Cvel_11149.t1-p1 / transcript=Cvel_11149.t1 / gene=Cvel_11149 / organism=Chromera_velia_CCMP2878 / gene_product=Autoinducer 2 sensor kinase/phosphatase LuxQ, putative / transcript_product=Autoinducer 2 sensor kinase/phosphatase LuxQ, putative / location=Cvel_scaffold691:53413-54738(-) / protein_length=442 / sequence_SO=supercontig / SO=protein_coding / is_pseudo=false
MEADVYSHKVLQWRQDWVRLRFSVVDEGVGIEADEIPKLFKPYSQIRAGEQQRGGGTGLGLCISRVFVEAHCGGQIGAVSEGRGKGSEFFFQFDAPLAVESKTSERGDEDGESDTGKGVGEEGNKAATDQVTDSAEIFSVNALEAESVSSSPFSRGSVTGACFHMPPAAAGTEEEKTVGAVESLQERRRSAMEGLPSRRESLMRVSSPKQNREADFTSSTQKPGNHRSASDHLDECTSGKEQKRIGPRKASVQLNASEFLCLSGLTEGGLLSSTDRRLSCLEALGKEMAEIKQAPLPVHLYTADVLLVDDNQVIQLAVSLALKRLGLSVAVSDDGAAALARFRDADKRFRLVLMDRNMPNMEGPEAIREIRTTLDSQRNREKEGLRSPSIKPQMDPLFIGLTGQTEASEDFLSAGAARVLFKPVTPKLLKAALDELGFQRPS